jgi:hypothetical protein
VQIILAQADRDVAIFQLLEKLGQVYSFMAQDETLGQISSMHAIVGQISQQTLECAHFISDYSERKNFCEPLIRYRALHILKFFAIIIGIRLGKNVGSETDNTIQKYNNVLDMLMQNFRDQVIRDVALFIHQTSKHFAH